MSILKRFKPPSGEHWFGTDEYGRDVLSRTLFGARLSLLMGIGATMISVAVGVPLGLFAGYRRGALDEWIMRGTDVLMSFPPILLGLLVLAEHNPGALESHRRGRHRLRAGARPRHPQRHA